jgi:indolepyruvate ferredoxin oxidoreductase
VQYRRLIEAALPRLGVGTHARITALAALPDMVRGYEEVKLASVEAFRKEAAGMADDLGIAHDFRALVLHLHPAGSQPAVAGEAA